MISNLRPRIWPNFPHGERWVFQVKIVGTEYLLGATLSLSCLSGHPNTVTSLRLVFMTACIWRARNRRLVSNCFLGGGVVPSEQPLSLKWLPSLLQGRRSGAFLGQSPTFENLQPAWKSVMTPWWAASSLQSSFHLFCYVSHPPSFHPPQLFLFWWITNFFSDLNLGAHFHLKPAILSYILFNPSPQIILPMFVLVETSRWEMLDLWR